MEFQADAIERVINHAIKVMEESKEQVYEICSLARSEMDSLNQELLDVMKQTTETIEKVDTLEIGYRVARNRLSEVSRDFHRFTEEDIKQAYKKAMVMQLELSIFREKEVYLRARREELLQRVNNVKLSIERAELIGLQMNVVLEYLSGDLNQVTRILESAKSRQLLGLKIILAQEEERKRIAREVHDGPTQTLAHLILKTEIIERMLGKQDETDIRRELADLKGQIRLGLEEMRKTIFNLRPMALDDLGLVPALRKFVQDFEDRTTIHTSFEFVGKEIRFSSAMEAGIFRLVQEAFTNAHKHSNASYVELTLTCQTNIVKIRVRDNGIGFAMEALNSKMKDGSHFGLVGMKERVELLEGRIDIQSVQNEGTMIEITIPVRVE